MSKRLLVIAIFLAILVSMAVSVSALAQTVGDDFANVKNTINDGMEEIKEAINKQNRAEELPSFNNIPKFVKTQEVTETIATVAFVEGSNDEIADVTIETKTSEKEVEETEPVETGPAETEAIETEPVEATEPKKEEEIEERLRIILVETKEDDTKIYTFKGGLYTVPDVIVNEEPKVTASGYVEKICNVPQYFQQSYPKTRYGNHGTISSHGCGITSLAMVFSYIFDKEIMPDELAAEYGRFNTKHGSAYSLFETSAEDYGIEVTRVHLWQDVVAALEKGCVVIANVRENLFTSGGHYIVYYGITEDGKILVRDPNIYNFGEWSAKALKEGFNNGFEDKYVKYSFPCWVYAPKDIDAIANAAS